MAVKQGYPPESLNSLADLLDPDLVEEVLEAYWEENGDEPRVWTIDMAWKLLAIGRETKCLPESDLAKLDDTAGGFRGAQRRRHNGKEPKRYPGGADGRCLGQGRSAAARA